MMAWIEKAVESEIEPDRFYKYTHTMDFYVVKRDQNGTGPKTMSLEIL
jgi:hypothetical protein